MTGCIYYFSTAKHIYTLGIFSTFHGADIAPSMHLIPYETLPSIRNFGPGTFIFTDFDRMSSASRDALSRLTDRLAAHGCPVLNHPTATLRRFDLLRQLHRAGLNNFNVYRLPDWREARHFPVFIRRENTHQLPTTNLLPDAHALERAIGMLTERNMIAADMMIVEFGNRRAEDGRYRKYSAFKVGDLIYAQCCYLSSNWWIKFATADKGDAETAEHLDYVATNPHLDQLERIYDIAKIQYGRIDYCVVDGKVQTFEINTNPSIIHRDNATSSSEATYARPHEVALLRLLAGGAGPEEIGNPLYQPGTPPRRPASVSAKVMEVGRLQWTAKPAPAPGGF